MLWNRRDLHIHVFYGSIALFGGLSLLILILFYGHDLHGAQFLPRGDRIIAVCISDSQKACGAFFRQH